MIRQFFEILLYLVPRGKPEHLKAIRTYLKIVASITLPRNHPLRNIHILIAQVDAGMLETVLQMALKCNSDSLGRNLDPESTEILLGRSISAAPAQTLTDGPTEIAGVVAETLRKFLQHGAE
jgi:hypothetical protein